MPLTKKDGSPPQQTIAGGVPMYVYKGMSIHQLKSHVEGLERRLAEANALLDKVYQYVDSRRLGKLGQSRVDVLIADHKRLTAETCRHNWQMSLDGGTYICTECGGWK